MTEEQKILYDEIMHNIYDTVLSIVNESQEQKPKSLKGFRENFLDNKDVIGVAYADSEKRSAYAFIYQKVDDNEYDVYHFCINLQNGKIDRADKKFIERDEKLNKKSTEQHLKAVAKKNDVKVRDIYTDIKDIRSIFETISDDPRDVVEEFFHILHIEIPRSTDEKPRKKGEKKEDDKKSVVSRDKDGKLTGKSAEYAKNIAEMLKNISKDDDAFVEVVRLFNGIKMLAEKTDGNYARAIGAINSKLLNKKK